MVKKSGGSVLMSHYINQKASRLEKDMHNFGNITSSVPSELSSKLTTDAWMPLEEPSSTKDKTTFFKRFSSSVCSPRCTACFLGLVIGSLLAGIALAVLATVSFGKVSTSTSTTPSTSEAVTMTETTTTSTTTTTVTTSTTTTTVTTPTTTTTVTTPTTTTTVTTPTTTTTVTTSTSSTTTTTQASAIAYSSLASFCGCSGFTLSLSTNSFNATSVIYQWQSSLAGQNIWSDIDTPNSISSLFKSNQTYSSDYQCQIIIQSPSPMNLTSTIVTVMTTTNISPCQTLSVDCGSFGDDINNFILVGELSTQINDLDTNCSTNGYDNRTQESVSLYENRTYTAQASTQYSGGGEDLTIWIDFNNNFQFEFSEQVASQSLNTYNTNVMIAIPSSSAGATIGVHRMRATLAYSAVPDSCGTSSAYGETHDYTVNILSLTGELHNFS